MFHRELDQHGGEGGGESMTIGRIVSIALIIAALCDAAAAELPSALFHPPASFTNSFGKYPSLLRMENGRALRTKEEWPARRAEIAKFWERELGPWPPLLELPVIERLTSSSRENFNQHRVRLPVASDQLAEGYLLVPKGAGPFPAALVVYYEPETSIGQSKQALRDFGYQLARRGFVTLSIGSPGGDARKPDTGAAITQPLSFLAYIAANCHRALAALPEVDAKRIGVVGHSYGGKWAMFAMALYEPFACGVWSDPGIVFDETRSNVNYWEPWYLGKDATQTRKPGIVTTENGRTGAYKRLYESKHDLHEILALIAPRPFMVSGGSEDPPARWEALNRVNEVYHLLGATNRVAMSNRPVHDPSAESNELIYRFFEEFLK